MISFFGKNKNKKSKPSRAPDDPAARREALKAEAMANARAARAQIGDETLQKIAQALSEQNKSPGKKAQDQIRAMDKGHVADHIKSLLDK
jgi:hypothetical protein